MDYQKQNFQDGQTLTAAQLNHIEEGISKLAEELAEGGGGGGPSLEEIVAAVLAALPTWNGGSY